MDGPRANNTQRGVNRSEHLQARPETAVTTHHENGGGTSLRNHSDEWVEWPTGARRPPKRLWKTAFADLGARRKRARCHLMTHAGVSLSADTSQLPASSHLRIEFIPWTGKGRSPVALR